MTKLIGRVDYQVNQKYQIHADRRMRRMNTRQAVEDAALAEYENKGPLLPDCDLCTFWQMCIVHDWYYYYHHDEYYSADNKPVLIVHPSGDMYTTLDPRNGKP